MQRRLSSYVLLFSLLGCAFLIVTRHYGRSNDVSPKLTIKSTEEIDPRTQFAFLRTKNESKDVDCDRILFAGTPFSDFNMSSDYWAMKPAFEKALADLYSDKRYPQFGHSGRVEIQTRVLHYLASRPWVHTVCETGFNAGHSAFNYLTANRKVIVHSFDLAQYPFTAGMARAVESLFPGRFFFYPGDSKQTVPQFASSSKGHQCNLILVDGGHEYGCAISDLLNLASIASVEGPEAVVVFDDNDVHGLAAAWNEVKQKGFIEEIAACRMTQKGPVPHANSFVFGKVIKRPRRENANSTKFV